MVRWFWFLLVLQGVGGAALGRENPRPCLFLTKDKGLKEFPRAGDKICFVEDEKQKDQWQITITVNSQGRRRQIAQFVLDEIEVPPRYRDVEEHLYGLDEPNRTPEEGDFRIQTRLTKDPRDEERLRGEVLVGLTHYFATNKTR